MELFGGLAVGLLVGILLGTIIRSKQIYDWPAIFGYEKTKYATKFGRKRYPTFEEDFYND